MALRDLFVPKWKHSRVDVRIDAINTSDLDPSVLQEIARNDISPEVRITAIGKIENETTLDSIINFEKNEKVRAFAQKKQDELLDKLIASSSDMTIVLNALKKRNNEKMIVTYLSEHTLGSDLQSEFIKEIKTPALLCKLTESGCAINVCEEIVSRIDEKELLERISEKASNKKIRTLAHQKLEKLYPDPRIEQQKITAQLEECIKSIDIKVTISNLEKSKYQLEDARSKWRLIDPELKHPLYSKFTSAERNLQDQISRSTQQKELLKSLNSIAQEIEELEKEPVESIDEKLVQIKSKWESYDQSGLTGDEFNAIVNKYTVALSNVKNKIARSQEAKAQIEKKLKILQSCCDDLEKIANSDRDPDSRVYDRILSTWESNYTSVYQNSEIKKYFESLQEKFAEKVKNRIEAKRISEENEKEYVSHLVQKMESIAESKPNSTMSRYNDVLSLKRKWQKNYPLAKELKKELESRFSLAYEKFMSNYHEYKEQDSWKEWAHENVKTKLLTEIETFADKLRQNEFPLHLMRKVSNLQNQWRRAWVQNSEKSKELNEKFTAICNDIFAIGLSKKQELFERLKTILADESQNDSAEEVKNFQKQWNDIGYLPPEVEKNISDEFYSLCNSYFEQRKEQHQKYIQALQENVVLREEICKEAENLVHSTEWKDSITKFDELQKKWDESWPAPMKRSRELWVSFAKSRDQFFERYEEFKKGNDSEKEELCLEAEKLLANLESIEILPSSSSETNETNDNESISSETPDVNYNKILSQAVALRKKWNASGPASKTKREELWNRFNVPLTKVFSIIEEEHKRNFEMKEALVKEAEELAQSDDWDNSSKKFAEIREKWRTIKSAAYRDEQMLWTRLKTAGDTFFDRRRNFFDERKKESQKGLEEKKELLLEMELLVRLAGKRQSVNSYGNESAAEILKRGIDLRNKLVVEGDQRKTSDNINRYLDEIIKKWEKYPDIRNNESFQVERKFQDLLRLIRSR